MARSYLLRGHPKPANENEARDVDFGVRHLAFVDMSNVLNEVKKQQVIALRRLGWRLRGIEQEIGECGNRTGSLQHWLPGRRLWHSATESGARRAALS